MGGYSALGRMRISPSIYCFATQTRKRITDPASSTKIDQGSTPPNASGPNINSPNTPYSRTEASCAESGCGLPLIEYMFMRICCLFCSEWARLLLFSRQAEVVDPELTTDRTTRRKTANVNHQQLAIGSRGKVAARKLPEACIFQFVTVEINGRRVVHILNRKMRPASALDFAILIVGGKFVLSLRFHRHKLIDSGVSNSGTIKGDRQRAASAMKVAWVEC